jgi:hypothetical protein
VYPRFSIVSAGSPRPTCAPSSHWTRRIRSDGRAGSALASVLAETRQASRTATVVTKMAGASSRQHGPDATAKTQQLTGAVTATPPRRMPATTHGGLRTRGSASARAAGGRTIIECHGRFTAARSAPGGCDRPLNDAHLEGETSRGQMRRVCLDITRRQNSCYVGSEPEKIRLEPGATLASCRNASSTGGSVTGAMRSSGRKPPP